MAHFSAKRALPLALLLSTLSVGNCDGDHNVSEATPASNSTTIVPVTSSGGHSVYIDGSVVDTERHVVDPWIRPPRGVRTQEAIGRPGDFDGYPRIVATPYDSVEFLMRPVARVGPNTQRHGVYLITDKGIVQDYLEGKTEHPCGEPVYTSELPCQVIEYEGLNATDCPSRATLFPLLEIFGGSGVIGYTTSELGDLADEYGVETESGSRVLAFDCPWIQGRNDKGSGRTSHCIGGMFQIVEVLAEEAMLADAASVSSEAKRGAHHCLLIALAVALTITATLR